MKKIAAFILTIIILIIGSLGLIYSQNSIINSAIGFLITIPASYAWMKLFDKLFY